MAGLVSAARARELGAGVGLFEKGDRPGGSVLLSSGVVWRYRDFDEFRRQCRMATAAPAADLGAARRGLDWLEGLGVAGSPHATNPLTTGRRFDPAV
jgi:phytoene dehydrogenase-like protein